MQLQLHNSLINIKPDDEEINPLMWRKSMAAVGPAFPTDLARRIWRYSAYLVPQLSYILWLEVRRIVVSGLCWRHSWSITTKIAPNLIV